MSEPPPPPGPPPPAGGAEDFPPPPFGQTPYGQTGGPAMGGPPPNYLVFAILSTILCCLPLGIASIVFAAQVNSKYTAGDVAGAQQSSERAKQFAIASAIVGAIGAAVYLATL